MCPGFIDDPIALLAPRDVDEMQLVDGRMTQPYLRTTIFGDFNDAKVLKILIRRRQKPRDDHYPPLFKSCCSAPAQRNKCQKIPRPPDKNSSFQESSSS